MRGIKPSIRDGHIVTILDKPYFGEVGLVIGRGRFMPEGRRRFTDSEGRGKMGWGTGTYRIFLCDPKWGSKVVNVRANKITEGRYDLSSTEDRLLRIIDTGESPEDRETKSMLESSLSRKATRIRCSDVEDLGLSEGGAGWLIQLKEGVRLWP